MQRNGTLDADPAGDLLHYHLQATLAVGLAGVLALEDKRDGAKLPELFTKQEQQRLGQRQVAVLFAFAAAHIQRHSFAVDIGGRECKYLAQAQARAIGQHEHGAVLAVFGALQQGLHFLLSQHFGVGLVPFGARNIVVLAGLALHLLVVKFNDDDEQVLIRFRNARGYAPGQVVENILLTESQRQARGAVAEKELKCAAVIFEGVGAVAFEGDELAVARKQGLVRGGWGQSHGQRRRGRHQHGQAQMGAGGLYPRQQDGFGGQHVAFGGGFVANVGGEQRGSYSLVGERKEYQELGAGGGQAQRNSDFHGQALGLLPVGLFIEQQQVLADDFGDVVPHPGSIVVVAGFELAFEVHQAALA